MSLVSLVEKCMRLDEVTKTPAGAALAKHIIKLEGQRALSSASMGGESVPPYHGADNEDYLPILTVLLARGDEALTEAQVAGWA